MFIYCISIPTERPVSCVFMFFVRVHHLKVKTNFIVFLCSDDKDFLRLFHY